MRLLLALALGAIILASGCVRDSGVMDLDGVEIRDYEGEPLSPVSAIRDVSIKGPQDVDIRDYRLKMTGLVDTPLELTYEEVLDRQAYSKVVELHCVMGWTSKNLWEGVLLEDLFSEAGASPEADTVIFRAVDGYSTSLARDFVEARDIMIAYKVNNITLTPATGYPFILVAEQKWGYKWIKWINEIELSDDEGFQGYWESRGYSNEGDLDEHY